NFVQLTCGAVDRLQLPAWSYRQRRRDEALLEAGRYLGAIGRKPGLLQRHTGPLEKTCGNLSILIGQLQMSGVVGQRHNPDPAPTDVEVELHSRPVAGGRVSITPRLPVNAGNAPPVAVKVDYVHRTGVGEHRYQD